MNAICDILSAHRIAWGRLTRSQIETVMFEAGVAGDTVTASRARRALARRGWM